MIGEDLPSDMNRRVDSNNRAMTHVSLISAAFNLTAPSARKSPGSDDDLSPAWGRASVSREDSHGH
jgi:hypothetical protein